MATEHEAVPEGMDARILVDVDPSILGAPEERFNEYDAQVRPASFPCAPHDLQHGGIRGALRNAGAQKSRAGAR